MSKNPLRDHIDVTRDLARSLKWQDVYHWLVQHGYFPENYVLPPCFRVVNRPKAPKHFFKVKKRKKRTILSVPIQECCEVHFPKTALADRRFGIIHPEIHNDIAYHIARNWKSMVDRLLPEDSDVYCYSFPIPVDTGNPGRVGRLRSGRAIYEFLWMTEDDIASVAYRFSHVVRTDIKNFYPSIYTHSIAWALHGKTKIRKGSNRWDYTLLGNRLDKLFQYANDQRTNGLPIGPAVSDLAAELILGAIDKELSAMVREAGIDCVMTRFKDDYRFLVRDPAVGRRMLALLQACLSEFQLELSERKTVVAEMPDGLFRPWVSHYHAAHPSERQRYSWKQFRELYIAVLRIDQKFPGTGVIDRFLADIVSKDHRLKVSLTEQNLQKVLSLLLMLGRRRLKAFPKVLAIFEAELRSPFGILHTDQFVEYLKSYFDVLAEDERRNQYLLCWITYFFNSNGLGARLKPKPKFTDPVTRSVLNNRPWVFKSSKEFKLFEGVVTSGRRVSMLEHLDVFNPPETP